MLSLPPADASPEEEAAFCGRLREVCHSVGFFYVRSHGVEERTCDAAIDAAVRFFALPAAVGLSVQVAFSSPIQFTHSLKAYSFNP